eukprot:CAMPEP_0172739704 /NCGR_PEP_ID=MMETSP1074-20121228/123136_1 /TAXON_ID=2916 /ORGANISM="Ceratium fusus, Strain PA161109" /LENGTH=87 /DNA_ID=CAMNT_0013569639 /DNA_START=8 /DNA_END=268 /DNA_ORIENTATION=-
MLQLASDDGGSRTALATSRVAFAGGSLEMTRSRDNGLNIDAGRCGPLPPPEALVSTVAGATASAPTSAAATVPDPPAEGVEAATGAA